MLTVCKNPPGTLLLYLCGKIDWLDGRFQETNTLNTVLRFHVTSYYFYSKIRYSETFWNIVNPELSQI